MSCLRSWGSDGSRGTYAAPAAWAARTATSASGQRATCRPTRSPSPTPALTSTSCRSRCAAVSSSENEAVYPPAAAATSAVALGWALAPCSTSRTRSSSGIASMLRCARGRQCARSIRLCSLPPSRLCAPRAPCPSRSLSLCGSRTRSLGALVSSAPGARLCPECLVPSALPRRRWWTVRADWSTPLGTSLGSRGDKPT